MGRLKKLNDHHVILCRKQRIIQQTEFDGDKFWSAIDAALLNDTEIGNLKDMSKYKNKKDDVHLAVDMVFEAVKNTFDTAILISGDEDILPAVEKLTKEINKKVHLVAFAGRTSPALFETCNTSEVLDKQFIKRLHYLQNENNMF